MLKDDKSLVKVDRLDADGEVAGAVSGAADARKMPFQAPAIRHHDQLPVITAGSISQQAWGFAS